MFIAGQNGSGKSTLATALGNAHRRVLVYDPKNDPAADMPNAAVVRSVADARRALPGRVIYRPGPGEAAAAARNFDRLVEFVLTIPGGHAIVVHELGDLATAHRIEPALAYAIRAGRSLGITPILVTQRPVGIPVLARSEAKHVVCFTLIDRDDRAVMASVMGDGVRPLPLPLDRRFWYRGPDLRLHLCQPLAIGSSHATSAHP